MAKLVPLVGTVNDDGVKVPQRAGHRAVGGHLTAWRLTTVPLLSSLPSLTVSVVRIGVTLF